MPENRASFFARIDYMPPTDKLMVRESYDFGKATHRKQIRKELDADGNAKRYFEHGRSVSIIAIDELHITSAPIIGLGLMHDSLEDADPRAEVTPELIEHRFGSLMVRRLLLLSKKRIPENASEEERARLKAEYTYRLHHYADLETLIVKGCDRLHNLRTLCCPGSNTAFIIKQCEETRRDYVPLFAKMEEMARGTEFHAAALKLRILIHEELARCGTRLVHALMNVDSVDVVVWNRDRSQDNAHTRMDDDGAPAGKPVPHGNRHDTGYDGPCTD